MLSFASICYHVGLKWSIFLKILDALELFLKFEIFDFVYTDGGYETVPDAEASARLDPSSVCSPPRNEHGYEQVMDSPSTFPGPSLQG
jgi:hypothetical protein